MTIHYLLHISYSWNLGFFCPAFWLYPHYASRNPVLCQDCLQEHVSQQSLSMQLNMSRYTFRYVQIRLDTNGLDTFRYVQIRLDTFSSTLDTQLQIRRFFQIRSFRYVCFRYASILDGSGDKTHVLSPLTPRIEAYLKQTYLKLRI